MLALLILHADGYSRRDVLELNGAVEFIDALTAGAALSADMLDNVVGGDLDVEFFGLG